MSEPEQPRRRPGQLVVAPIVTAEHLEPCVSFAIVFTGEDDTEVLLSADDSYSAAANVVEAAQIATLEASLIRFLMNEHDMVEQEAGEFVVALRKWRADRWAADQEPTPPPVI